MGSTQGQSGRARLSGIESLRAYAATAIIMFHLVGSGGIKLPEELTFIGNYFGQGVPLFFVVSGFSLAYGYFGRLATEQMVTDYFRRRFFRIAPLFYVALVFQLFYLWLRYDVTFSWTDITLNATFLFNFIPKLTDGIVPASWTIGVEMLFYAMFPVLLLWCKTPARSAVAVLLSILIAGRFGTDTTEIADKVPQFVYHNFLKNASFFMWGIFAFHALAWCREKAGAHARFAGWMVTGLGLAGILLLYHWTSLLIWFQMNGFRSTWDTFWGLPFALLCLGLSIHPTRVLSNRITRYLGEISFSTYIVHANILYELGRAGLYTWVFQSMPGREVAAYFVCFALSLVIITAVAAITYRLIEVPGMRLGRKRSSEVPASAA